MTVICRYQDFADAYSRSEVCTAAKGTITELNAKTEQLSEEALKLLKTKRSTETPIWWAIRTYLRVRHMTTAVYCLNHPLV